MGNKQSSTSQPLISNASQPLQETVKIKPLSTFLGTLLPENVTTLSYNGKTVSPPIPNALNILGNYEAVLTQACYMARLAYEPDRVILGGVQLINYDPIVFNTGLGIIRRSVKGRAVSAIVGQDKIEYTKKPYITDGVIVYRNEGLHETPCYLQVVDYKQTTKCPFPNKKVLYVVFRGTISAKSGLTDANLAPRSLATLLEKCVLEGKTGLDAFNKEVEETKKNVVYNNFGAHMGFVDNLKIIVGPMLSELETLLKKHTDIDHIVVTGHSLGGANATIGAMILAGFKRAGVLSLASPKLHCITFGAPKIFTDYSRNVFNSFLDEKILTLDRVANRVRNLAIGAASIGTAVDLVPLIPPNFNHPGYMILKTEIKTQSRTGRSKNISEIREMFGNMATSSWFAFNSIPTYQEFLNNFEPLFSASEYGSYINKLPFGTIFSVYGSSQYATIKALVESILKTQVEDINEKETTDEVNAAKQTESESLIESASAAASSEVVNEEKTGGALNETTSFYKDKTLLSGSNHIVYACQKNVSTWSCHMGYMGVSYNAALKNAFLHRKDFVNLVPSGETISLVYPEKGGRKTYRHKKNRKSSRKTKKRSTI